MKPVQVVQVVLGAIAFSFLLAAFSSYSGIRRGYDGSRHGPPRTHTASDRGALESVAKKATAGFFVSAALFGLSLCFKAE